MKNGSMQKMIVTSSEEKMSAIGLKQLDDIMLDFRTMIRAGEEITNDVFEKHITSLVSNYQCYLTRK
jgi:hypothetical protein